MKHEREICRWARTPDGTKVWVKYQKSDKWRLIKDPIWSKSHKYIVDDKHAEVRKRWIDEGEPTVQFLHTDTGKWTEVLGTPNWDLNTEYRLKPKEWYENIPEHGVLCYAWDENEKEKYIEIITEYVPGDVYKFIAQGDGFYMHAEPITPEEVEKYLCKCSTP